MYSPRIRQADEVAKRSQLLLSVWQDPDFRVWTRAIALLVTLTFVLPFLTWAFNRGTYASKAQTVQYLNQLVEIPKQYGRVMHAFQGGDRLVVHIQDLHCNYEVQKHIAKIIDYLAGRHNLRLVALEGASRPVDVSKLSTFPVKNVKQEVGDYFLRQGKISGAEFYAALGRHKIDLVGIEDAEQYKAGRETVMTFLNNESLGYVWDLREILDELKPTIYSRQLIAFDAKTSGFRNGELSLFKYCRFLYKAAKRRRLDLQAYPQLTRYANSHSELFSSSVDPDQLYLEIDELDHHLRTLLYTHADQESLDQLCHRLDIMEKMLNISVSNKEFAEYRAQPYLFKINTFQTFIRNHDQAGEMVLDPEVYGLEQYLKQVEAFYANADLRSQGFVRNLLERMDQRKTSIAVLVSGGYHTQHVIDLLRMQNVSYVSLKAALSRVDVVNPYFSLLQKKRTPLEKLLAQNQNIINLPPGHLDPVFQDQTDVSLKACLGFELKDLSLRQFKSRFGQAISRYTANTKRFVADLDQVVKGRKTLIMPFTGVPLVVAFYPKQKQALMPKNSLTRMTFKRAELAFYPRQAGDSDKTESLEQLEASLRKMEREGEIVEILQSRLLKWLVMAGLMMAFSGAWLKRMLSKASLDFPALTAKLKPVFFRTDGSVKPVFQMSVDSSRGAIGRHAIREVQPLGANRLRVLANPYTRKGVVDESVEWEFVVTLAPLSGQMAADWRNDLELFSTIAQQKDGLSGQDQQVMEQINARARAMAPRTDAKLDLQKDFQGMYVIEDVTVVRGPSNAVLAGLSWKSAAAVDQNLMRYAPARVRRAALLHELGEGIADHAYLRGSGKRARAAMKAITPEQMGFGARALGPEAQDGLTDWLEALKQGILISEHAFIPRATEDDILEYIAALQETAEARGLRVQMNLSAATPEQAEALEALGLSGSESTRDQALSTVNNSDLQRELAAAIDVKAPANWRMYSEIAVTAEPPFVFNGKRTLVLQVKSKQFIRRMQGRQGKLPLTVEDVRQALHKGELCLAKWNLPLVFSHTNVARDEATWLITENELREQQAAWQEARQPRLEKKAETQKRTPRTEQQAAEDERAAQQAAEKEAKEEAAHVFSRELRSLAENELQRLLDHPLTQALQDKDRMTQYHELLNRLKRMRMQVQREAKQMKLKRQAMVWKQIDYRSLMNNFNKILRSMLKGTKGLTPRQVNTLLGRLQRYEEIVRQYLFGMVGYHHITYMSGGSVSDPRLYNEVSNQVILHASVVSAANKRLMTLCTEHLLRLEKSPQMYKTKVQKAEKSGEPMQSVEQVQDRLQNVRESLEGMFGFYVRLQDRMPALFATLGQAYGEMAEAARDIQTGSYTQAQLREAVFDFYVELSALVAYDFHFYWMEGNERPATEYNQMIRHVVETSSGVFQAMGWENIDVKEYFNIRGDYEVLSTSEQQFKLRAHGQSILGEDKTGAIGKPDVREVRVIAEDKLRVLGEHSSIAKNHLVFENRYSKTNKADWERPQITMLDEVKKIVGARNPQTISLLDIGCGDGQGGSYELATLGFKRYVGLDFSENAVKDFRSRLGDLGWDNVELKSGQAGEFLTFLEQNRNSFDIIHAHLSLQYFSWEETLRLFELVAKRLKPGGQLVFKVFSTHETSDMSQWINLEKNIGRHFYDRSTLHREHIRLFSKQDIDDLLNYAGLKAEQGLEQQELKGWHNRPFVVRASKSSDDQLSKIVIDRKEVAIYRGGQQYNFEYKPIDQETMQGYQLNYYGVGGKWDDWSGTSDIAAYAEKDPARASQLNLWGVTINKYSDLRDKGLLRPLLNLFFHLYPGVERTHPNMRNLLLQDMLIRKYGFGPEEDVEPNVWMRRLPKGEPGDTAVRAQVFFENEAAREWFRKFPPDLKEQYEIVSAKNADFLPLYLGTSLVVKDRQLFADAQTLAPISVKQAYQGPGGIMPRVKEWYVNRGKPEEAVRQARTARYDRWIAFWLENGIVLAGAGLLLGIPLFMATGDISLAARAGYALAWPAFFGLHFLRNTAGERAPPFDRALAGFITVFNLGLLLLPLSFPVILAGSFLSHFIVNQLAPPVVAFFSGRQKLSAPKEIEKSLLTGVEAITARLLNNHMLEKIIQRRQDAGRQARDRVYMGYFLDFIRRPEVVELLGVSEIDQWSDQKKITELNRLLEDFGEILGNVSGPVEALLQRETKGYDDFRQAFAHGANWFTDERFFNSFVRKLNQKKTAQEMRRIGSVVLSRKDEMLIQVRMFYLLLHAVEIYSRLKPDLLDKAVAKSPEAGAPGKFQVTGVRQLLVPVSLLWFKFRITRTRAYREFMRQRKREGYPAMPGAAGLLEKLAAARVPLYLATASSQEEILPLLSRHALAKYFKDRIFDIRYPKSDTLARAHRENEGPGTVVMWGDRQIDMQAVQQVPDTIGVGLVLNPEQSSLKEYGAEGLIRDFSEVRWEAKTRTLRCLDLLTGQWVEILNVKAMVFDYDGTLEDNQADVVEMCGNIAAELLDARPGTSEYEQAYQIGVSTMESTRGSLRQDGIPRLYYQLSAARQKMSGQKAPGAVSRSLIDPLGKIAVDTWEPSGKGQIIVKGRLYGTNGQILKSRKARVELCVNFARSESGERDRLKQALDAYQKVLREKTDWYGQDKAVLIDIIDALQNLRAASRAPLADELKGFGVITKVEIIRGPPDLVFCGLGLPGAVLLDARLFTASLPVFQAALLHELGVVLNDPNIDHPFLRGLGKRERAKRKRALKPKQAGFVARILGNDAQDGLTAWLAREKRSLEVLWEAEVARQQALSEVQPDLKQLEAELPGASQDLKFKEKLTTLLNKMLNPKGLEPVREPVETLPKPDDYLKGMPSQDEILKMLLKRFPQWHLLENYLDRDIGREGIDSFEHGLEVLFLFWLLHDGKYSEQEVLEGIVAARLLDFDIRDPITPPKVANMLLLLKNKDLQDVLDKMDVDVKAITLMIERTDHLWDEKKQSQFDTKLAGIPEAQRQESIKRRAEALQLLDKTARMFTLDPEQNLKRVKAFLKQKLNVVLLPGKILAAQREFYEKVMQPRNAECKGLLEELPDWARQNWESNCDYYKTAAQEVSAELKPAPGAKAKKPILNPGVAVVFIGALFDLFLLFAKVDFGMGWGTGLSLFLLPYFAYRLPMMIGYFRKSEKDSYELSDFREDLEKLQGLRLKIPDDWNDWINQETDQIPDAIRKINIKTLHQSPWRLLLLGGIPSYYHSKTNTMALHKSYAAKREKQWPNKFMQIIEDGLEYHRLKGIAHELTHYMIAQQTPVYKTGWRRIPGLAWVMEEARVILTELRMRRTPRLSPYPGKIWTVEEVLDYFGKQEIPPLITGASGFVGSHLTDQVIAGEQPVIALCRSREKIGNLSQAARSRNVFIVETGDYLTLDNLKKFERLVARSPLIYHVAAQPNTQVDTKEKAVTTYLTNVFFTGLLAFYAKKHGTRMVYGSSAHIYTLYPGQFPETVNEETPLPISPEAEAFVAQAERDFGAYIERFAQDRAEQTPEDFVSGFLAQTGIFALLDDLDRPAPIELRHGLYSLSKIIPEAFVLGLPAGHSLALRFTNAFGPRQRPSDVQSIFTTRIAQNKSVFASGDTRDYIYISDSITALKLAGQKLMRRAVRENTMVLIASGRAPVSMSDLLNEILRASDRTDVTYDVEPETPLLQVPRMRTDQARELLGWQPQVGFSQGIQQMVNDIRAEMQREADLERIAGELNALGLDDEEVAQTIATVRKALASGPLHINRVQPVKIGVLGYTDEAKPLLGGDLDLTRDIEVKGEVDYAVALACPFWRRATHAICLSPDRQSVVLIQRATPPYVGTYALPSGVVGLEEPLENIEHEIQEEPGLAEPVQSKPHLIFLRTLLGSEDVPGRQILHSYYVVLSEDEYRQVKMQRRALNAVKERMTENEFQAWLNQVRRGEQISETGLDGEVSDIQIVPIAKFIKSRNFRIRVSQKYRDGTKRRAFAFTPDTTRYFVQTAQADETVRRGLLTRADLRQVLASRKDKVNYSELFEDRFLQPMIRKGEFERKIREQLGKTVLEPVFSHHRSVVSSQFEVLSSEALDFVAKIPKSKEETGLVLTRIGLEMTGQEFAQWVNRVHKGKYKGAQITNDKLRDSRAVLPPIELKNVWYQIRNEKGIIEKRRARRLYYQPKADRIIYQALENYYKGGESNKIKELLNQVIFKIQNELWTYKVYEIAHNFTINWGVNDTLAGLDARLLDFGEMTIEKKKAIQFLVDIQEKGWGQFWYILNQEHPLSLVSLTDEGIARWFLGRVKEELTAEKLEDFWGRKLPTSTQNFKNLFNLGSNLLAYGGWSTLLSAVLHPPYARALLDVAGQLDQYLQVGTSTVRLELKRRILQSHRKIPESVKRDFKDLLERLAAGQASCVDLTGFFIRNSGLAFIHKTKTWTRLDGTTIDRKTHIVEVNAALDALLARQRAEFPALSDQTFEQVSALAARVKADPALRQALALAAALHDYAILAGGDHYLEGAELAGDLLNALGLEARQTALVQELILRHDWPWNLSEQRNRTQLIPVLGEVLRPGHLLAAVDELSTTPEVKDDYLAALGLLGLADIQGSGDRALIHRVAANIAQVSRYDRLVAAAAQPDLLKTAAEAKAPGDEEAPEAGPKKTILNLGILAVLAGVALDLIFMAAGVTNNLGFGTGLSFFLLPYFVYRLPLLVGYFRKTEKTSYALRDFKKDLERLQGLRLKIPNDWHDWINGETQKVPPAIDELEIKTLRQSPLRLLLLGGIPSYYHFKTNTMAFHKSYAAKREKQRPNGFMKTIEDWLEYNRLKGVAHELTHYLIAQQAPVPKAWWNKIPGLSWIAEELQVIRAEGNIGPAPGESWISKKIKEIADRWKSSLPEIHIVWLQTEGMIIRIPTIMLSQGMSSRGGEKKVAPENKRQKQRNHSAGMFRKAVRGLERDLGRGIVFVELEKSELDIHPNTDEAEQHIKEGRITWEKIEDRIIVRPKDKNFEQYEQTLGETRAGLADAFYAVMEENREYTIQLEGTDENSLRLNREEAFQGINEGRLRCEITDKTIRLYVIGITPQEYIQNIHQARLEAAQAYWGLLENKERDLVLEITEQEQKDIAKLLEELGSPNIEEAKEAISQGGLRHSVSPLDGTVCLMFAGISLQDYYKTLRQNRTRKAEEFRKQLSEDQVYVDLESDTEGIEYTGCNRPNVAEAQAGIMSGKLDWKPGTEPGSVIVYVIDMATAEYFNEFQEKREADAKEFERSIKPGQIYAEIAGVEKKELSEQIGWPNIIEAPRHVRQGRLVYTAKDGTRQLGIIGKHSGYFNLLERERKELERKFSIALIEKGLVFVEISNAGKKEKEKGIWPNVFDAVNDVRKGKVIPEISDKKILVQVIGMDPADYIRNIDAIRQKSADDFLEFIMKASPEILRNGRARGAPEDMNELKKAIKRDGFANHRIESCRAIREGRIVWSYEEEEQKFARHVVGMPVSAFIKEIIVYRRAMANDMLWSALDNGLESIEVMERPSEQTLADKTAEPVAKKEKAPKRSMSKAETKKLKEIKKEKKEKEEESLSLYEVYRKIMTGLAILRKLPNNQMQLEPVDLSRSELLQSVKAERETPSVARTHDFLASELENVEIGKVVLTQAEIIHGLAFDVLQLTDTEPVTVEMAPKFSEDKYLADLKVERETRTKLLLGDELGRSLAAFLRRHFAGQSALAFADLGAGPRAEFGRNLRSLLGQLGFKVSLGISVEQGIIDRSAPEELLVQYANIHDPGELAAVGINPQALDLVSLNNIDNNDLIAPALGLVKPGGVLTITHAYTEEQDFIANTRRRVGELAAADPTLTWAEIDLPPDYPASNLESGTPMASMPKMFVLARNVETRKRGAQGPAAGSAQAEADDAQGPGDGLLRQLRADKALGVEPGIGVNRPLLKQSIRLLQVWRAPRISWMFILYSGFSVLNRLALTMPGLRGQVSSEQGKPGKKVEIMKRVFPRDDIESREFNPQMIEIKALAGRAGLSEIIGGRYAERDDGRVGLDIPRALLGAIEGDRGNSRLLRWRQKLAAALVLHILRYRSAEYYQLTAGQQLADQLREFWWTWTSVQPADLQRFIHGRVQAVNPEGYLSWMQSELAAEIPELATASTLAQALRQADTELGQAYLALASRPNARAQLAFGEAARKMIRDLPKPEQRMTELFYFSELLKRLPTVRTREVADWRAPQAPPGDVTTRTLVWPQENVLRPRTLGGLADLLRSLPLVIRDDIRELLYRKPFRSRPAGAA